MAPIWLSGPLMCLGLVYIVFEPLDQPMSQYFLALGFALAAGVFLAYRYQVTVLQSDQDGVTVQLRLRHRRRSESDV